MISFSKNKSFESLYDELIADINADLQRALVEMVSLMVEQSPVDTGRFISNWYALIDKEGSETDSSKTTGGSLALSEMVKVIEQYSISENEFIYIYNNVYSDKNSQFYAATVAWDPTRKTAQDILDAGENRFAGII